MNVFIRVVLLLFLSHISLTGYTQLIKNPSFEGPQRENIGPSPWTPCNTYSSPDTQPGFWNVTKAASDGNTYISLVTRGNLGGAANYTEAVQAQLNTYLVAGKTYKFSIDLALSETFGHDTFWDGFISYANPVVLKIWGGTYSCEKTELLWQSPVISHTDWKTYDLSVVPQLGRINFIILEAYYTTLPGYFGNILIDNIVEDCNNSLAGFSLGNDKAICQGEKVSLNATRYNVSHLWQDGTTNPGYEVSAPGLYWVKLTSAMGCSVTDSIFISYNALPAIELGEDKILCEKDSLLLDVTTANASYLWQDMSTNSTYTVTSEGMYWVKVTVNNCSVTDKIYVTRKSCEFLIPNVITPNDDGINDYFIIKTDERVEEKDWSVQIYNRWGHQVYRANHYKNDWNANNLDNGIYFYFISNNKSRHAYKGTLSVLR